MARESEKLSPSLEDYLEAVLILVRRGNVARVRDIAAHLGVGKSSVTGAVKTLAKRGLVNYEPYQFITLTDHGRELAEEVSARHVLLRKFLSEVLGLDEETAEANACRMEHAVDAELLEQLGKFSAFVRNCPRAGTDWVKAFVERCGAGDVAGEICTKCVAEIDPADGKVSIPDDAADGEDTVSGRSPAMPLTMVSVGQEVRLAEVTGARELQHRLAEMGLTPGARFSVVNKGNPGPFIVSVKGSKLMLGRGTVHRVMVKAGS
ncbi:MAG: metal-dependent transcriptional regulator [Phycisphaerae bacterium]|jgi:DtxR family Mn-dependent transcriptional regulator|nr:metal-dependent transcriptional regulator [Phycisphaerae bacterium]